MERRTLRVFAVLSAIALGGLVAVQVYWFGQAFNLEERDFGQRVTLALLQVNDRLHRYNHTQPPLANRVEQVSGAYFKVMVNDFIHPVVLEEALRQEFARQQVRQDFEFGIYDCLAQQVQYRQLVCQQGDCDSLVSKPFAFPVLAGENYYFGVYFPGKTASLVSGMEIWIFSSLTLVVVVFFFLYSLFFIFRQKKLSELQRDFVNNLTHEFKTPLAAIGMSVETLAQQPHTSPERKATYLAIIQRETQRLHQQVERILQLASAQEKMELYLQPINLRNLLQVQRPSWELIAAHYGGTLGLDSGQADLWVLADRVHLTNILFNLIDNALKYNGAHPQVTLAVKAEKGKIRISVTDNGAPFSEAFKKKVFDRFFRGANLAEELRKEGFGLGLYYVRNTVKAMLGRVEVVNLPQGGKQFSVWLPATKQGSS